MQSDDILTHQGMTQNGKGARILLLACGALAREILALIERNAWTHIDLKCLPAILHNAPEKITPLIREKVLEHQDHYDRIFVVYADCGTGGQLQTACDALGVEMMAGPHCYSFFEGNAEFAARDEFTAFYLTDFLVRQFDAFSCANRLDLIVIPTYGTLTLRITPSLCINHKFTMRRF